MAMECVGHLDDSQHRAVEASLAAHAPSVVVGAPGTGKSLVARAIVARHLAEPALPQAVLWCTDRRRASAARDQLVRDSGTALATPAAVTAVSFALAVVRGHAAQTGQGVPTVISGPEQDARLADILRGHAQGIGRAPTWPAELAEALPCSGFRAELRDLLMRCAEQDVPPQTLERLGREMERPDWVAAADVYRDYLDVLALRDLHTPGAPQCFDHPAVLARATRIVASHDEPHTLLGGVGRIVIDDAQEANIATWRFVEQLVAAGVGVTALGDPDAATLTFRGAAPGAWLEHWTWAGDASKTLTPLTLSTRYRQGARLSAAVQELASKVGTSGVVQHRTAGSAGPPGALTVRVSDGEFSAHADVASALRASHRCGVPWGDMAVIARKTRALAPLRSALERLGIPASAAPAHEALRDYEAVVLLRSLSDLALRPDTCTDQMVLDVLAAAVRDYDSLYDDDVTAHAESAYPPVDKSPVDGSPVDDPPNDGSALDNSGGESVHDEPESAEPLCAHDGLTARIVASSPLVRLVSSDDELPAGRAFRACQSLRRVLVAGRDAAAAGRNPHETLWALWHRTGLSDRWRDQALRGGRSADVAHTHLDAMMALFDAAGRFALERPHATVESFWRHVDSLNIATDTLAQRGDTGERVQLGTPSTVAGQGFHTVVIVDMQEGLWPNPALRDSLLGASTFADVWAGRSANIPVSAQRDAVIHDEVRMAVAALSRARVSAHVVAVASEDAAPSAFIPLLSAFHGDDTPPAQRPRTPNPLAPRHVVTTLRQMAEHAVASGDEATARQASAALAALAKRGVTGARPGDWWKETDVAPWTFGQDQDGITVSPSTIEKVVECPLRWFLTSHGFDSDHGDAAEFGTLMHDIVAENPSGSAEELVAAFHEEWAKLGHADNPWRAADVNKAEYLLARWAKWTAGNGRTLVATEAKVTANVGGATIVGRVDRLEQDADGHLTVVDLKTSASAISNAEAQKNAQLGIYQTALQAPDATCDKASLDGARTAGAVLVYPNTSAKKVTQRDQDALDRHENPEFVTQLIEDALGAMTAPSYPALTGSHCDRCPVQTACPAHSPTTGQPRQPLVAEPAASQPTLI